MIGDRTLAIDIQTLETPDRDRGIGRYTSGLIHGLLNTIESPLHLCGFAKKSAFDCPKKFNNKIVYHQYPGSINREIYLRNCVSAPLADCIENFQPDIFIASSPLMPDVLIPNRSAAKIGCILYDLIPNIFRGQHPEILPEHLWFVQHQREQLIRHFDFAFSISEATRRDAITRLNWNPEKIKKISTAIDPGFFCAEKNSGVLKKYNIATNYILTVSGFNFRKNWQGGLEAFAALPKQLRKDLNFILVCTLSDEQREEIFSYAEKLKIENQLIVTGFVSDEDLPALYQNAQLFLFPTLYEGFGIPVAEAMASGCPVVSANNSSLPEVVGDAGLMADADDPQSLASAIQKLLTQTELREDLILKAKSRSQNFKWEKVAENFIQSLAEFVPEIPASKNPTLAFLSDPSSNSLVEDIGKIFAEKMNREFSNSPVNHSDVIYMISHECDLQQTLSAVERNGASTWNIDKNLKPAIHCAQEKGIAPLPGIQAANLSNLDKLEQDYCQQLQIAANENFQPGEKLIRSIFAQKNSRLESDFFHLLLLSDFTSANLENMKTSLDYLQNNKLSVPLKLTVAGRVIEPQILKQLYLLRRNPTLLENLRITSLTSIADLKSTITESQFVWISDNAGNSIKEIYKMAAQAGEKNSTLTETNVTDFSALEKLFENIIQN